MAGPSASELKFLLSMNDQASGVLKGWIGNLEAAGKGASDTEGKNKTLGTSFDNLVAKAKEASVAIAGIWASNKLAQTSISQFAEYEKGLYGIALTTGNAGKSIGGLESDLNDLSKQLNVVPVEKLEHFAETAGRLGLRGSKDILTFTSTAAKLSSVLKVSDDGVQAIGRMLFATGELESKGVKSVTDFADALAAVQPNTKATAEELVQFTSSLGTNTAAFHIASDALLGIGAAAAQSNLPLQLTGTVVGQAFIRIKDAALSGSQGMQMITRATGVTQDQFQTLLNSKPQEAFLVLLQAINKLNKEGSSTPLLNALQLQGAEYTRVFTTLGGNIDTIREKIKQASAGAQGGGILDRLFGDFQKLTAEKTSGLSRAFEGVVRDIGKALAPVYNAIVTPITAAFDFIDTAFRAFNSATAGWGPTIVASLAVIGPGVAGAVAAITVLGPAALSVLKAFSGWNILSSIAKTAFGALPGLIGGVSTALGVLRVALGALLGPWGLIATAAVAAAALIYENWGKLKDILPSWLTGGIEAVANGLDQAYEYAKGKVKGWFKSDADKANLGVKVDQKSLDDAKKKIEEKATGSKYTLDANQLNALKTLSPQIEGRVNLSLQQNALDAARRQLEAAGGKEFTDANSGLKITDDDVRRAQKIADYQKQVAENPLFQQADSLNDQIAQAQALTASQKNELAIRKAIDDTVNKTGVDEAKVTAEIGTRMRLLQQSQQYAALTDQARSIQDQTRALGAVTAQEKSRAQIIKQINDFEREHGALLDADKQKLVDMLATYNQQAEAVRLLNSLDPRAAAEQRYQSEQKTLDTLRQQGQISQQLYQADTARLAYQRSQSDPTTKHIQDLRDELRISQEVGDQQKIDQIALQERNTLQSQGVVITKQLNEQIQKYAQAKVAADNANNSGLSGWAKQQGTIEDNLNKIQENFADGLADAVTGALSGERGGFRTLLANLGKQMLSTGIRQIFAQNILAFTGGGSAAAGQANNALNQIEQLSKSGVNSPTATINATQAIINGPVQGVGTPGTPAAGTSSSYAPSNSQISAGSVAPSFTPVPAAPAIPSVPSVGPTSAVSALAPSQSAITDAATKAATVALPNFATSPAFAAAAAAATKSVSSGAALKDITGETVKALPPDALKTSISEGTTAIRATAQPGDATISPLLGKASQRFESGNRGVFAYSNTRGDPGGASYGEHQLSAGGGSLGPYLRSPEGAPYTSTLRGLTPGTRAFNQEYQRIARNDPQGFAASQNAYYARANYYPKRDFAINKGFNLDDRGVQEAIFSGSVQHGGFNRVTADAARRLGDVKNATPEQQIDALYAARRDYVAYGAGGRRLGPAVKQGVLNRYGPEERAVQQYAGQPAVPDGQRPAPTNYGVQPPAPNSAQNALTTGSIDTSQATQQVKQLNTTLQQTGTTAQTAVQPMKSFDQTTTTVGQATQQAQQGMQGLTSSAQSSGTAAAASAPSYTTLGTAAQTAGTSAQTAGSSFQSAGSQIQAAGSSAQSAGASAGGATGDIGGFGGSITGLLGPLASAKGGIGSFGSSLLGFVQQLLSSSGGLGGGGGGLFGGIGSLFGGLFAEGGEISGPGTGTSDSIMAQVSNGEFIVNAKSAQKNLPLLHAINNDKTPHNMPKFAKGGVVGGSSLSLGERALSRSSAQPSAQVAALSNQVAALSKVVSNSGANGQRNTSISQNITVNANDAGSFRRSEGQLTSDAFLKMNRAARRNG